MTTHASTLTAVSEHDAGRLDRAESLYRDTLAHNPQDLAALIGLGDVLSDARQVTEAEQMYRRALAIESDSPAVAGAYDGLAAILQDAGDLDGAVRASKKAAVLRGDADDAFGVATSLEYLGRIPDAIEMFQLAASLRHEWAEAHAKAGQHLMQTGRYAESITHYQAAVQAKPEVAELHCNLAAARQQSGEANQALNSARAAIELKPQLAEAHNVMGAIWKDRGRWADALGALGRAVQLKPDFADALNNTAVVLQSIGRVEEATPYFQQAVTNRPEVPQFHISLAVNLLLRGDYQAGFAENEWRRADPRNSASRAFAQPIWNGQPLAGQTLLLHAEQPIGHTILFLRYVAMVRQHVGPAAKIVLEIQPQLAEIARQIKGNVQIAIQGDPLPDNQLHFPLLSLARLFGTLPDTVPGNVPYVQADAEKAVAFPGALSGKLPGTAGQRRIGLALGDSSQTGGKRDRNGPAGKSAALSGIVNAAFFNLDKSVLPAELGAIDLKDADYSLSDMAAVIQHMDVVVTADNSIAHLAGAMGKKTLVLLGSCPDWCWMLERADSPWYPTAKLLRKSESNSWGDVIQAAAGELKTT